MESRSQHAYSAPAEQPGDPVIAMSAAACTAAAGGPPSIAAPHRSSRPEPPASALMRSGVLHLNAGELSGAPSSGGDADVASGAAIAPHLLWPDELTPTRVGQLACLMPVTPPLLRDAPRNLTHFEALPLMKRPELTDRAPELLLQSTAPTRAPNRQHATDVSLWLGIGGAAPLDYCTHKNYHVQRRGVFGGFDYEMSIGLRGLLFTVRGCWLLIALAVVARRRSQ